MVEVETMKRTHRAQSGSILVEMALVIPVLMLIVAGMIEVGAAWRDKSTVVQASRQGARVASNLADNGEADRLALLAILAVLPSGGTGSGLSNSMTPTAVAIYDATPLTGLSASDAASCRAGTFSGAGCNYYDASKLTVAALIPANFDGTNADWDGAWEPTSERDRTITTGDLLAIHVRARRPVLTNMFPGTTEQRITSLTVMKLEPTP